MTKEKPKPLTIKEMIKISGILKIYLNFRKIADNIIHTVGGKYKISVNPKVKICIKKLSRKRTMKYKTYEPDSSCTAAWIVKEQK